MLNYSLTSVSFSFDASLCLKGNFLNIIKEIMAQINNKLYQRGKTFDLNLKYKI